MAEETIRIEVIDEELDAALEKTERSLEGAQSVDEVVKKILKEKLPSEEKLEGQYQLIRRAATLLPGIREAYYLSTQIRMLLNVSPEIAALLLAVVLIRAIQGILDEQKKKQQEYESLIREFRHFTSREQISQWQDERRQLGERYRNQPTP